MHERLDKRTSKVGINFELLNPGMEKVSHNFWYISHFFLNFELNLKIYWISANTRTWNN